jgi:hypothetical protein
MFRRSAPALALLIFSFTLAAQTAVPSPDEFLAYPIGARFTPHHRIVDYFEELDRRSELVTMRQIGESYEHRPLMLATITSAANQARLDRIRENARTLANGAGDVDAIVRDMPALVWLAFGVHGNESSSAEAGMMVASALVNDVELRRMLDDVVVIIDPLENPDGRERYISWFARTSGTRPNPSAQAFEHQEPWPGGRFNHYLIDMNRDWAWQSQKETQARVAAYREMPPQVVVDFHEMSAQSSYFFPPDAKPINLNLPQELERWLETFGRANAAEFSKRNWTFFVGERFDLFYPGYGDSWPSLNGAIGMTYEVAGGGRAGTTIRREDESVLRLADRAQRHYTTGIATVRTAAQNREALLRYTHRAARANIEAGKNTYLLAPGSPNFNALVELLTRQGVRVEMLSAPATIRATRLDRGDTAESRTFAAGTAVVSTRQPLGGLVNTLLEKAPQFSKGFVEAQRARAELDEEDEFYDITTWSLPLAMNVEAWVSAAPVSGTTAFSTSAPAAFRAAAYGYLADGLDPQLYRFAGLLLREGIRFNVLDSELTADGRTHARGSIIILKGNNENLDGRLNALVREAGVAIVPLESGWIGNTALGSEKVRFVRDPKIGLVGGPGSDATSFGMLWHTLDVDTPIPHSTLNAETLRNLDLAEYRVLVFPDGSYADRLTKRGVDKIKQWVTDGGTLVAIKGAHAFLREKDVEISKLKPWEAPKTDEKAPAAEQRYNDFRIPGAAFRTSMNERSYLTFGVPRPPAVLVEGSGAFLPLAHRTDNILTIDAREPLISGVAWPESIERIKGSVYVTSEKFGRGQVITFADDPNYRLFWRGTLPVFLNAVLYGPSFPR